MSRPPPAGGVLLPALEVADSTMHNFPAAPPGDISNYQSLTTLSTASAMIVITPSLCEEAYEATADSFPEPAH